MECYQQAEGVAMLVETLLEKPVKRCVYGDNRSAVSLCTVDAGSWRTRLRLRAAGLREAIMDENPKWFIHHIPGSSLVADGVTKALQGAAFGRFLELLQMEPWEEKEAKVARLAEDARQRQRFNKGAVILGIAALMFEKPHEQDEMPVDDWLWCAAGLVIIGLVLVGALIKRGIWPDACERSGRENEPPAPQVRRDPEPCTEEETRWDRENEPPPTQMSRDPEPDTERSKFRAQGLGLEKKKISRVAGKMNRRHHLAPTQVTVASLAPLRRLCLHVVPAMEQVLLAAMAAVRPRRMKASLGGTDRHPMKTSGKGGLQKVGGGMAEHGAMQWVVKKESQWCACWRQSLHLLRWSCIHHGSTLSFRRLPLGVRTHGWACAVCTENREHNCATRCTRQTHAVQTTTWRDAGRQSSFGKIAPMSPISLATTGRSVLRVRAEKPWNNLESGVDSLSSSSGTSSPHNQSLRCSRAGMEQLGWRLTLEELWGAIGKRSWSSTGSKLRLGGHRFQLEGWIRCSHLKCQSFGWKKCSTRWCIHRQQEWKLGGHWLKLAPMKKCILVLNGVELGTAANANGCSTRQWAFESDGQQWNRDTRDLDFRAAELGEFEFWEADNACASKEFDYGTRLCAAALVEATIQRSATHGKCGIQQQ